MSLQPLDESTQKYFETRGAETPPPAPAPEPPTPEPAAAIEPPTPDGGSDDDNKGQFVRLGALHEERAKRREFERQLQEERSARERLEARTNEILKRMQEPETPAPQVPEWNQDPLGHTKQRLETQEERLARLEQEDHDRRQMTEQQHQYVQFRGHVAQHTHQFMAKTPDYPQAYQHLMEMQGKALEVAGFAPEQIRQTLDQFETAIAQKALADGVNPAERAYAMAKQMGYKGAAPAAAGPSAAEQKLQRIAEGQRTSASLSDAAGSAKPQLDAKTLADMPDEEFAKIWSNRKQVRQILGR